MPLKPVVLLFIAVSCFHLCPAHASFGFRVSELRPDTIARQSLVLDNISAVNQKKSFFKAWKYSFLSFILKKQDKKGRKVSAKAALGIASLSFIVFGLLLIGSAVSVILLPAGVIAAIVSLALPKSKTEIEGKQKSNLPAIIALSVFLGAAILVAIVLSSWGKD